MGNRTSRRASLFLAALLIACSAAQASSPGSPQDPSAGVIPPAPAFEGWTLQSDTLIPRENIAGIEAKLHGKINGLRNVIYLVNGKKIQINVIVPGDQAQGDQIFRTMTGMKAAWSVARRPEAIYEFVGQNESANDIKKAQARLSAL